MNTVDLAPRPLTGSRFTGTVSGADHVPGSDPRLHVFVVEFAAGGRTAWHSHAHGQLLICTSGRGAVGTRDGRLLALRPGDAVWTEPGEEHWHGADPDAPMTHVAVQTREPDDAGVRWGEPVTDTRDAVAGPASRISE